MSILENYKKIEESVIKTARFYERDPEGIKIIAVSKNHSVEIVQDAINAGIKLFGENRVQETKNKISKLKGDFNFHMIGHLQSNKARDAVKLFNLIHSIDKTGTALKVNNEAEKIDKIQDILVQVNTSGEISKSGIDTGSALNMIKKIIDMKNLNIMGLMTMAPFTDNENLIRDTFKGTKELLNQINSSLGMELKELSMGMSSDYTIAIEEGATMIRIGAAIFGERVY